jgi:hypothetical protein
MSKVRYTGPFFIDVGSGQAPRPIRQGGVPSVAAATVGWAGGLGGGQSAEGAAPGGRHTRARPDALLF